MRGPPPEATLEKSELVFWQQATPRSGDDFGYLWWMDVAGILAKMLEVKLQISRFTDV